MKHSIVVLLLIAIPAIAALATEAPQAQEPPTDWIDAATGHRVIRLSGPGGGSSLYFHQNTYTPEGDKLIFNAKGAIMAVDIKSLGDKPPKAEVVVQGSAIGMAWRTREVYFPGRASSAPPTSIRARCEKSRTPRVATSTRMKRSP